MRTLMTSSILARELAPLNSFRIGRHLKGLGIFLLFGLCSTLSVMAEDSAPSTTPRVSVDNINTDQDTTISIQKGKPATGKYSRYEILTEEDSVSGDPALGRKAAHQAWKVACAEWKKEIKNLIKEGNETGKESKLLSVQCGNPKLERDTNGQVTYQSTGKYRMRVLKEEASQ